jgi:histidinol-phosphate aminotransferase
MINSSINSSPIGGGGGFFRPHIINLIPYSSARDEYTGKEGVFLDANENPYSSADGQAWNRYPDPHQTAIKYKLAPIKGVRPTQIFLGNGSDEPIDLLVRAACEPQSDSILIMPPTYGMYEVSADINNVPVIKVPLTPDFEIDIAAVLAAIEPQTKIIWICSPNNPTGNLLDSSTILQIVEQFKGLVVVDEAYIDFADNADCKSATLSVPIANRNERSSEPLQGLSVLDSCNEKVESCKGFLSELDNYPNLVVLQTFSKAWGMAGLRLGMCFASEEIIAVLNKIKSPYNLSAPTQQLLFDMLDHEDEKNDLVAQILAEREKLKIELLQLPIVQKVYHSDSNMLLVRFDDAAAVMKYLIDQKIIVRDRSKIKLCDGCLRISVGTELENNLLIASLKHF